MWSFNGTAGSSPLTIVSGQGTTCITINIPAGYNGLQKLKVVAINCKGPSDDRTADIKWLAIPAMPGSITGVSSVCKSNTKTFSISSVTNATSYSWSITGGATIQSGQGTTSVSVKFTTATTTSATLSVKSVNSCGMSSARTKTISVALNCKLGSDEEVVDAESSNIKVFPNPVIDKVNIYTGEMKVSANDISIYDILGKEYPISAVTVTMNEGVEIDLSGFSRGMYFIRIKGSAEEKIFNIIKQ